MALELQKDFERLSTRSPRSPAERTTEEEECEHDARAHENGNACGDWKVEMDDNENRFVKTTRYTPHTSGLGDFDDTPTPPIDVPNPLGDHGSRRGFNGGMHDSYGYDEAFVGDAASSRTTSLSFDPTVKLDTGDRIALEAPVPKLPPLSTGSRGRSLFEEIARHREGTLYDRRDERDDSRARSETDREEYDSETGERFDLDQRRRDPRYVTSQSRWPFLQSTVDEIAAAGYAREDIERPSLTSRTTASPLTEEVRTPDIVPLDDAITSPISIPSPASRSEWSSPMPSPRHLKLSARSRSYGTERKATRRSGTRRTASSSMSPASAFLSKYMPVSPLPDPDAEGQEVGDYVMGREIGFGGFSIIREAYTFNGPTRIRRAVKIVRREVYGKGELENESLQAEFEHEVSLWRYLHHKHILPLLAVYISDFATFAFMQMNTGGTLFDAVRFNRGGLPGPQARKYAYQLASALRYLHEDMRIVHRDVKLENCLIDNSSDPDGGTLLLCDFGLADYIIGPANPATMNNAGSGDDRPATAPATHPQPTKGQQCPGAGNDPRQPQSPYHTFGPSDTSTSLAGSLPYAAPELLELGRGLLDPRVDVWSYGVVCYAMVAGKLPFAHSFAPRVRMMILGGEYDRTKLSERESEGDGRGENGFDGMRECVEACLERDPALRPDIRWVLECGWLDPERVGDDEVQGWDS